MDHPDQLIDQKAVTSHRALAVLIVLEPLANFTDSDVQGLAIYVEHRRRPLGLGQLAFQHHLDALLQGNAVDDCSFLMQLIHSASFAPDQWNCKCGTY